MTLQLADPSSERGRICAALLELIDREGYPSVTMVDLERASGLDEVAFHRSFVDLEDCFLAIWECFDEELDRRIREAFEREGAWRDRFHAGLAATLDLVAAEPAGARLYVVESAFAGGDYGMRRGRMMDRVARMFDAAPSRDELSPPRRETISEALAGGIWQHVHRLLRVRRAADAPKKLPQLMFLSVLPFLGPEAAEAELWRGPG